MIVLLDGLVSCTIKHNMTANCHRMYHNDNMLANNGCTIYSDETWCMRLHVALVRGLTGQCFGTKYNKGCHGDCDFKIDRMGNDWVRYANDAGYIDGYIAQK